MTNENEQAGFAISCDGLWVTGFVEAGGERRWMLGTKEQRVIYPTDCAFLLRFDDAEEKATAEKWAERAGFPSLTAYILEAVGAMNRTWARVAGEMEEHAGYEARRAEESA